jgi:arylsulfatase A-like enzyme
MPRTDELRRRLEASLAVGGFGALALALVDARWLRELSASTSYLVTFVAALGIIAPLALLVATALGVASWLVHPRVAPSIPRLLGQLRGLASGRPADVAALVPLATLGLFVWTTLSSQIARATLALEGPSFLVGAATALGSLVLLALVALLVLAATPWLRHALARAGARTPWLLDPAKTLGLALLLVAALVAHGVWHGTVSGEGDILGIYGILKRPELDLRMPGAWLAFTALVYLGASILGGSTRAATLALPLVALALTVKSSRDLDAAPELARAFERGAPIGRLPLALLRRVGDRDRDGASRWYGGGDCDDRDPRVGPAVEDLPDNGLDEDCSGSDLSLAGLASAAPTPVPPAARERLPKRGNVVLITIDTLRADLGFAGNPRPLSPNLDALAKRSVVFERAYALASYTGKSVGPTLIGKYGSETHRNWGHFNKFSEEDIFVAERIRKAGLRTVSVHAHRYFGAFGGLDRGFEKVNLDAAPPEGTSWATDQAETSEKLTDAAIAELDTLGEDAQFFLWVHYLDPHADYLVHSDVPTFGRSPRDQYDHEVLHTDRHVGRLLDHLATKPWASRTNIVVTSDHGEAFGEHGMMRHGFELWEPLVRVPLLIHVPGQSPARVGHRRSLIDLTPTLLDLVGAPSAPSRDEAPAGSSDFVSGASLVSELVGGAATARDILVDMPAGPYNEARRALIHGDLKLIVSRDAAKELYDLAKDPLEDKDVWKMRRTEVEAAYALAKSRLRVIDVKGK